MNTPLPRLPAGQPSKPFAIYEHETNRVPDLHVREPIGDYSVFPAELAGLNHEGAAVLRLDMRDDIADPTQGVAQALTTKQPIAHRFVEHGQGMIDI